MWWFGSFKRPEMGDRRRERESPADERDALGYATVRTLARYTGAAEACDPLDL
jgi:hypothetical protein